MTRALSPRDVESKDFLVIEEVKEKDRLGNSVVRRLFWVLRRGEVRVAAKEEEEGRREEEVEDSLEGWREMQEGIIVEV